MLKELREKRAKAIADMRALIDAGHNAEGGARDLNAEESAQYDTLKATVDSLSAQIARIEGQDSLEATLNAPRQSQTQVAGGQPTGAGAGYQAGGAPGDPANREFSSLGEFMHAVRFNPNDSRLEFTENPIAGESRMDDGPSGGFAIPTQFREGLLSIKPAAPLVRARANVIPAGSPPDASVTMAALDQRGTDPDSLYGGVEVQWIGEGDEKPDAGTPKLREITLTPHEVAGTMTVTDKLLRNWAASDGILRNQLRAAQTAAEDRAFLIGNGIKKPLGGLVSAARYLVARAQAGKIVYADVLAMTSRLLMREGEISPIWIASQATIPQLATLKDEDGRYIWKPDARDGFAGTLMGYPLRISNRVSNLGGIGDLSLCDWSYYLIKDGSGPFIAASEHVLFKQNKTVIKIFWNVDGAPWLTAPITEENGWEVSPFVVLGNVAG